MSYCDGKWVFNNEYGGLWDKSDFYDTKREAERAAQAYFEGYGNSTGEIYIGQTETVPIPEVDATDILERLDEEYGEQCGGEYDDYLFYFDLIKEENLEELSDKINKAISEFCEKENIKSNWYHVKNVYKLEGAVRSNPDPGGMIPTDKEEE